MAQVTKTAYPSGLVASQVNGSVTNQNNPVGNGSGNTTYASCYLRTGSSAETYMTYGFDLSDIPDGATIVSVACTAKAYIGNTNSSRITSRQIQMFSGSTAKGTASNISTSTTAITMSVGTWTLAELRNARIRVYAKRGSSSTTTSYEMRIYGATLTVVYEYEDKRYLIKTGASKWTEVSKVYEKTSSGIVERSLEAVMTAIQNGKYMRYRGVYEGIVQDLIQFSILDSNNPSNIKTYNAELGMTWSEWLESEYNTEGYIVCTDFAIPYICRGDDIYTYIGTKRMDEMSSVSTGNAIIANQIYYLNYLT